MANISKQDRQGVRTPADLERKYNLGKSFAEVAGFAEDARRAAEQAKKASETVTDMFAKDIKMTGTLTNIAEGYFPPGDEEIETMQSHYTGVATITDDRIALYDFNNDGIVSLQDIHLASRYQLGLEDFSTWSGAVKSLVTMTIDLSDPARAIHFVGTNMWGRKIDGYIGVNFTSVRNPDTEGRLDALEARIEALEAIASNQN